MTNTALQESRPAVATVEAGTELFDSDAASTNALANNLTQIDYDLVKRSFSLVRLAHDEGLNLERRGTHKIVLCPFHSEKTPSCYIFEERRFKCFGCGRRGSILDFVCQLHPELRGDLTAAALYLIERMGGKASGYYRKQPNSKSPSGSLSGSSGNMLDSATADGSIETVGSVQAAPAVHQIKIDPSRALQVHPVELYETYEQLLTWKRYANLREYAQKRGWLVGELSGATPFPLGAMMGGSGETFLAEEPVLAFRKLILTCRTAEVFGLEAEFEARNRELCVGTKKRLLPETLEKWAQLVAQKTGKDVANELPRWLAKPGLVAEVPWEFDANEDAEALIICEGPGDGLRLYNEVHRSPENHAQWGSRWHITAADSCSTWNTTSLPRRPVEYHNKRAAISFFGGFRRIVVLFDGDAPGRNGAKTVCELARRQHPKAQIRNVRLDVDMDICDFFDRGFSLKELAELIKRTKPEVFS